MTAQPGSPSKKRAGESATAENSAEIDARNRDLNGPVKSGPANPIPDMKQQQMADPEVEERRDRNGNLINEAKKHKLTFADHVAKDKSKLTQIHYVESYKKYN